MVSFVGLLELPGVMFFSLVPLIVLMKQPRAGALSTGGH